MIAPPQAPTLVDVVKDAVHNDRHVAEAVVTALGLETKRKGATWAVLCPMHADRNPSLDNLVHKGKPGLFNCPACDETIDLMRLVCEVKGWSCEGDGFVDAVRFIADAAGIDGDTPPRRNGHNKPTTPKRATPTRSNAKPKPNDKAGERFTQHDVIEHRYIDEDGVHLFSAMRPVGVYVDEDTGEERAGKGRPFQQRANGVLSLEGVRRILYAIPQLLEGEGEVVVVEGEKCADRLLELGVVATTNPMGGGKWSDEYAAWLKAHGYKRVAVLPDHDEPGRKHAEKVAESCARAGLEVRVVEDVHTGEKGDDVVEWLEAGHTVDDLRAMIDATPTWSTDEDDADEVAPKRRRFVPFPTDQLPEPVRDYVVQVAAALKVDEASAAVLSLGVLSGAAGPGVFRVRPEGMTWNEPVVLWALNIARSGSNKSALLKLIEGPLDEVEKDRRLAHRADTQAHKDAGGDDEDAPTFDRLVTSDVTVEKLAAMLEAQPRGLLVSRDEASAWFGSFGRYSGSRDAEASAWCELWSGGTLRVDRKNGTDLYVADAAVAFAGGIQPGRFAQAVASELMRDVGLHARFIVTRPPSTATRLEKGNAIAEGVRHRYANLVRKLADRPANTNTDGAVIPHTLRLDEAATDLFVEWWNTTHKDAEHATDEDDPIAPFYAKLRGLCLRVAGLFHVVEVTHADRKLGELIDDQVMQRAIVVAEWLLAEAMRVYGSLEDDASGDDTAQLLEKASTGYLVVRDMTKSGGRRYRGKADATRDRLGQLVAEGVAEWIEPGGEYVDQGGKTRKANKRHQAVRVVGVDQVVAAF